MDIIFEALFELVFDGLIRSRKVPKAVKYLIVTALMAFLIWLFIMCLLASEMLWAKIFCGVLTAAFVVLYIVLLRKIHMNQIKDE